jgi:hypothetical protein
MGHSIIDSIIDRHQLHRSTTHPPSPNSSGKLPSPSREIELSKPPPSLPLNDGEKGPYASKFL